MATTNLICDMALCRLCGEENSFGTEIFPTEENPNDLSELVNRYLPLKVENDGKLPRIICPGCNIQLEATKSFIDLIIEGQTKLRQLYKAQQDKLHRQEKQRLQLEEALKSVNPNSNVDTYTIESDETGEKFLIQIFSEGPLFPPEHELSLRAEGLERPRRKRGRPPKPPPKQNEQETQKVENPLKLDNDPPDELEVNEDGKRRRRIKVPTRYSEALQGKELDNVFKQEGVIDEESLSESEEQSSRTDHHSKRVEEVIGRMENDKGEDLGQPVVVNKSVSKSRVKNKSANGAQYRRKRRCQCEICGKEFLHQGRYELHKKTHEVAYNCQEEGCDFTGNRKDLLEVHQSETGHVYVEAVEKIDHYGTLQLSVLQAESFLLSESEEELPPTVINDKTSLKNNRFRCEKCKKTFSCKQNFEVHVKAVHDGEKPFGCDFCGKRFSYANSLKLHTLQHVRKTGDDDGSNMQYKCPSCPKTFRHPSSLQYHRDSEHTNGRRFVCNKCDKPFKHRQLLQRHQLVHSDERPHRCSQCESAFKTRANLIHHSRTVHAGQRSHWCSQCNKSFVHKTALKLHQRWHSGVRPYQCDFCQKAFSQKGNLAEHRRIHTGEKPYQCDHCGRAFTTSSQFKLHRKRHLDDRPHRCEFCPKSFLHKVTLKCHTRRHLDDRPYRCQICPKTFPEGWALKKHERLHSGEKPHKCEICGKAFADGSNLTKHRKTHKNIKPIKPEIVLVSAEALEKSLDNGGNNAYGLMEETSELVGDLDQVQSIQLQQLIDQEGNPITFTTQDGQQVKVVTSGEDQEDIQGLLPDGTLIPINVTMVPPDKNKITIEEDAPPIIEGQLLESNMQFLEDDPSKGGGASVQFITDDTQNMCLVTTYNIEDTINPQYLNIA